VTAFPEDAVAYPARLTDHLDNAFTCGGREAIHQQPEVNYFARFSLQLISLER
jgi:hypothetical protein